MGLELGVPHSGHDRELLEDTNQVESSELVNNDCYLQAPLHGKLQVNT